MLLPELSRNNTHGTGPSLCFFRGLFRRLTNRNRKKIFVLGFHKTGTTSLAKALVVLGYRVCGFVNPKKGIEPETHTRQELFETTYKPLLNEYDVFEDTLWFMFYRELKELYPDAKFILSVRPENSWYESMVNHFGGDDRRSYRWIYDGVGDPQENRALYLQKYRQHNRAVRNYFNGSDNFLEMRLPEDFNWNTLCGFLKCKVPYGQFPHANSASSRSRLFRKMIDLVKRWYYRYGSYSVDGGMD